MIISYVHDVTYCTYNYLASFGLMHYLCTCSPGQHFKDRAEGFKLSLTTKLLRQLSLTERQTSVSSLDDEDYDKWGYFSYLPVSEGRSRGCG